MKKLKIYLDTSIINFIHADDAAHYKEITLDFFENYLDLYKVYISEIVIAEIKRTKDKMKMDLLLSSIKDYKLEVYDSITSDIEDLACEYIQKGVIPDKKFDDAMHIAFATYYEFDILLSWNFKHIANIKKQIEINGYNGLMGYTKTLFLFNPLEVIYERE